MRESPGATPATS
ncbi:hypothetical protein GBAR_LOCUS176 [Geodia barretti]|uniref:Uncharacterized protein n=1 Tax=Geodia barretti TaxID=519541 RepID=A0AA35QRN8_GEOBA|nr:hypothetical protein GBAR_LOCUS176 [Geodia barretti]